MDWMSSEQRYVYEPTGGPMPESTALNVFRDMLLGLDYCMCARSHQAGATCATHLTLMCVSFAVHKHHIAHRDIKPDNVLFCKSSSTYKIADLGVAHFFDDDVMSDRLTKTEGTPPFFAPECCIGASARGMCFARGE